jgi:acetyltransferase
VASAGEATQILHTRHIPNYQFPERIGSTLAAMWQRRAWLNDTEAEPPSMRPEGIALEEAHKAVQEAGAPGWLAPDRTEALLRAYGIPLPGSGLAPDVEGAVALADRLGYPVALKLAAEGVTHKTDVGGVALNIRSAEQLRAEWSAMMERVAERDPAAVVQGGYVQQMLKGAVELIVGVVRDPQFGPLVMAGTGGTRVEVTRDVAFDLAPLSARQARDLLDQTAAGKLLAGFRGAPPADLDAAVDVIVRLAQIMVDLPEIAEIEINPLMVMTQGGGAAAVDARVRTGGPVAAPPALAATS